MPRTDQARCREAMHRLQALGYQPIPSRYPSDRKRPLVPYREFWSAPGPPAWLDRPCRAVQVMTGAYWRLAVLDLDGPVAIEVFRSWSLFRDTPPTWEVEHTPGSGRHLWYSLPAGLAACPSRTVWELAGVKHEAIEVIGDRKLIVAPPSRHVKTGRRYRFLPGRSPREIPRPAPMPAWMLGLPDCRPKPAPAPRPIPGISRDAAPRPGRRYHSRDVIAAIPDAEKVALVASWGLRLASSGPNGAGWWECHALGREDRTPSAGWNERSGYYMEPPAGQRKSLFEIAADLGAYPGWDHARDALGDRYGVA